MAKNGERVWGKGRGVWKKNRVCSCVCSRWGRAWSKHNALHGGRDCGAGAERLTWKMCLMSGG